jgi:CDP-diacylglycerol--serine O-phosphatidyltransferase
MNELGVDPRRRGVSLLPNLLTTACLACGFFAIVSAINGDFARAGGAIFLAMIFDGLDGRVARWTRTESLFGKEYDSLADMVSFGLAPALVAYQWGVARIAEYGDSWGRFAAFVWFSSSWREPGLAGLVLTFSITAAAGALMVSKFAYPSFKQVDWDRRIKFAYFLIVPVFLGLIAAEPATMLLSMFTVFALTAPVQWLGRRLRRAGRSGDAAA